MTMIQNLIRLTSEVNNTRTIRLDLQDLDFSGRPYVEACIELAEYVVKNNADILLSLFVSEYTSVFHSELYDAAGGGVFVEKMKDLPRLYR